MKQLFVENIYILGLKKNEIKIRQEFENNFPKEKTIFVMKDGVTSNTNVGTMSSTLWNILSHNTIDEVSQDIFKNHMEIIRNAYDHGKESILILEEDARFPDWNETKWKNIETWLMSSKSWDIFYLGYCNWPVPWSIKIARHIVRVASPLAAHAYILNRAGMYKIITTLENNKQMSKLHIDKFFLKVRGLRKYAAYPMISFQETCPGLYLKACDKLRVRILFSTCCKMNQHLSILFPIIIIFLFTFWISFSFSKMIKKIY